jgi:enoyl-CoA hydratase/carnithine racemase
MEMILTGDIIDAQEALRIGLVNRIVPQGDVSKVVRELAKDLVPKSPISTRYAKEAIYKGMELNLDQGLRLEADLYFLLHTTKDRTEGIRAFQEKRKAHFEGR